MTNQTKAVSKVEYNIQLQSIFNLAALVQGLRVQEILELMNQAETLGPILDPSLYQQASNQLGWQREIVRAALHFQREVVRIANDPQYQPKDKE